MLKQLLTKFFYLTYNKLIGKLENNVFSRTKLTCERPGNSIFFFLSFLESCYFLTIVFDNWKSFGKSTSWWFLAIFKLQVSRKSEGKNRKWSIVRLQVKGKSWKLLQQSLTEAVIFSVLAPYKARIWLECFCCKWRKSWFSLFAYFQTWVKITWQSFW